MDDEELREHIDSEQFIDDYVERFTHGIETESVSTYEFDKMLLAKEGEENAPEEVIWGAVRDYSKHIGMLSEVPGESDSLREIQKHLHHLNTTPTEQAVNAFFAYLQDQYSSITTITNNRLIEIPDPIAPKLGDYPVVDVILYAYPGGGVTKTVEATYHSASFSVDDPESVFAHVNRNVPSGDVRQYADSVYEATIEKFETQLTANLVDDLHRETLETADYTELKEEPVPKDVNRLHAGKAATYWQKEIWNVDGIDATTGFARVWFLEDENLGIVEPSAGDFAADNAITRIKAELQGLSRGD